MFNRFQSMKKIELSPSEIWLSIAYRYVKYVHDNHHNNSHLLSNLIVKSHSLTSPYDIKPTVKQWLMCDFEVTKNRHVEISKQILSSIQSLSINDLNPIDEIKNVDIINQKSNSMIRKGKYHNLKTNRNKLDYIFTEGTINDWKKLQRKIGKILVYCRGELNLVLWYQELSTIIKQILIFYSGKVDINFWSRMYQIRNDPENFELEIFGWISVFQSVSSNTVSIKTKYIDQNKENIKKCENIPNSSLNNSNNVISPIEDVFNREKEIETEFYVI